MHREAITSKQREILDKLPPLPNFYLVGGTALALQIGHRVSVDFDFFTSEPLKQNLLQKLERIFGIQAIELVVNEPQQLTVHLPGTELTFLSHHFRPVLAFVRWEKWMLLSVQEIGADKAYVLGRRATWKDYVDLYYILKKRHSTLPALIALARKKYGEAFDARLFLEQLIYTDDVPKTNIIFLKDSPAKEELKSYFEKEIQKISP